MVLIFRFIAVFVLLVISRPVGGQVVQSAPPVSPTKEELVFGESFTGELDAGWSWLREQPERWRLRNGALEIHVRPGLADTVENALVRPVPERGDQPLAVEVTLQNLSEPKQQYEQAGITWYADDKPVFKLVKELVDGEVMIVPGRVPVDGDWVQLRLELVGGKYTAKFRTDPQQNFQTAASGDFPGGQKEKVSLQCYHGPEDVEHWFRFDDFRILKLH